MNEYGHGLATPEQAASEFDVPARRSRSALKIDAVAILTFYLFLLLFIPYSITFAPLGASGGPSTLFAAALFVCYLVMLLRPAFKLDRGRQPIRVAAVLFACVMLASYVSANRHAMPNLERNAADRGLISMAGWLAVLLLAADGIETMDRLRTLIRRVVAGVTAMAIIGIAQFYTGLDVTKYISVPGFSSQAVYSDVASRFGLNRPASTAAVPLEFAAVLAMTLALAIHQARFAPPGLRRRRWLQVALIGAALPMTVSRTAILGIAVACIVIFPSWPKRDRRLGLLVLLLSIVATFVLTPGILGTFRDLFGGNDAGSTTSRTSAYSTAAPLISQHPWLGRGFGTLLPQTYFFTDDQYLGVIIGLGVVGLVALLALFATGWLVARSARRMTADADTRDLAQSLAASVAVTAVTFANYDALGFEIGAGLAFLLLGCAGALWRLVRAGVQAEPYHLGPRDRERWSASSGTPVLSLPVDPPS